MNKHEKAVFYIMAAITRNLENDEVDMILESEEIDINLCSVKQCKKIIDKNVYDWLPGGPLFDWDKIKEKLERIGETDGKISKYP